MVLERFEDYHGEKTDFQTLKFRIIPEPSNRVIELESGGVDIALDIVANDLDKLSGNPDLLLVKSLILDLTVQRLHLQIQRLERPSLTHLILIPL